MRYDNPQISVMPKPFYYHRFGVLCEKCNSPMSRMIKYEFKNDGYNPDGTKKYRKQFAWISTCCKCDGPDSFVIIYRNGRKVFRNAKDYIKDYNDRMRSYNPNVRPNISASNRKGLGVLDCEPK